MAVSNRRLRRKGSVRQMLVLGTILSICVLGTTWFATQREVAHKEAAMQWAMERFGLLSETNNSLHDGYDDADQDLVADLPSDEGQWISPETLKFSYVVADGPEGEAASWQPLIDAIAESTGRKVEFHPVADLNEQLAAIKSGELHITGLNTGSVPRAVNACGFVPVCTIAEEGGLPGLRSVLIVPAESDIKEVADLKGKLVMFTTQTSNSGFKAPMALLSKDLGMNPLVDYKFGFAGSHDKAIELLASGGADVAAVASDLLERAIRNGIVKVGQFRTIYESERFPSAAFGYVHNLDPEIASQVRQALTGFVIADTPINDLFAHIPQPKIVPVSYKDDWALIRRIDNSLGVVHSIEPESKAPAS